MGRRGFGSGVPSIREGSHPPPYMSIQADLKEARELLDEIHTIVSRNSVPHDERVAQIKIKLKKRKAPRNSEYRKEDADASQPNRKAIS